jgi:hypothetical protein
LSNISVRERLLFGGIALVGAWILVRFLVTGPGYTDAHYHFNAANQLVSGHGLTDHYLWVYIGAPDSLPAPSHLYWMPLTSLLAALGMWLLNAPGNYAAAQVPLALMFAGTVGLAFWLGARLGQSRRHAWLAGVLTLLSGFFVRFWGATDTFAPYALAGGLCLVMIGRALETGRHRFWLLAGGLAALGHLTRADGLLLLLTGWAAVLWPFYRLPEQRQAEGGVLRRAQAGFWLTLAYGLVMLPWFVRNLNAVGTPLPVGGAQGVWFTEYNDLFSYPAAAGPQVFFADGLGLLLRSRWEALLSNLGTLVAVEGLIVLAPLMLVGLWRRRGQPFLRGFWVYAVGLHLAMTLVFPYPGMRGGLFHSVAALLPWWMALGAVGLDDVVDWAARRRRNWNARMAKRVFSGALVVFAVALSASVALPVREYDPLPLLHQALQARVPADARVMINDPSALFHYTGLGGVVLPNEAPPVILDIARQYDVDYLVLEWAITDDGPQLAASRKLAEMVTILPEFLTELEFDVPNTRLYAINDAD